MPVELRRTLILLLLTVIWTTPTWAHDILIDTGGATGYTGLYRINTDPYISGTQTVSVGEGTHFFSLIPGADFAFVVDASGIITGINKPAAATGIGTSTLTLQTSTITIDPELFTGTWSIPAALETRAPGVRTATVIKGISQYAMGVGGGTFLFDVSDTGEVSAPLYPDSAAQDPSDATRLVFKTAPVTVDPGLYPGTYKIQGFTSLSGVNVYNLVPGVDRYSIAAGGSFRFDLDGSGNISSVETEFGAPEDAANGVGSTLLFHTVPVHTDVGAYLGRIRFSSITGVVFGDQTLDLPPLENFIFRYGSDDQFNFDVADDGSGNALVTIGAGGAGAATASGDTIVLENVPVVVDPTTFAGTYFVNGIGYQGRTTVVLVPNLLARVGSGSALSFLTPSDHATAMVTPPSDTLNISGADHDFFYSIPTTLFPVTVITDDDPAHTYVGTYKINGVSGNVTGNQTFDLTEGTYFLSITPGADVGFAVDGLGQVSSSAPGVSTFASQLIMNPVTIHIDPGAYSTNYRMNGFGVTSGPTSYEVLHGISFYTLTFGSFAPIRFGVDLSSEPGIGEIRAGFTPAAAANRVASPTGNGALDTLQFNTTTITIDPNNVGLPAAESISFKLQDVISPSVIDPTVVTLVKGVPSWTLSVGNGTGFFFDIADDGTIGAIHNQFFVDPCPGGPPCEPPAVGVGTNTMTFNKTPVNFDPGAYQGLYRLRNFPGSVSGPVTYDFMPSMINWLLDYGSGNFRFNIDGEGNVTLRTPLPGEPPYGNDIVTTSGNTLTFRTVPVRVDPKGYTGTYNVNGIVTSGIQVIDLVPTLPAELKLSGVFETFTPDDTSVDPPSVTISIGGGTETFCFEIVTDEDPPIITIDAPLDGSVSGASSVTIDATIADASTTTVSSTPAGISASLPEGGGAVSGSLPLNDEGANTLAVSAVDAFGNPASASITVIRDTIAPGVTILSPASGTVLGASPATLSIAIDDATETTVDFGGNSLTVPAGGGQVSGDVALTEGTNTISILATDEGGNTTSATIDLILDLTAPIVTIDSPADGACFGPGGEQLALSFTVDDLSSTDLSSTPAGVTGSLPAGGGISTQVITIAEGANLVTVTATDAAGRAGSASITVTLDTTAPTADLLSPEDGDLVSGEIDFDVDAFDAAPGSGIDRVDLFIDGNLEASLTALPYGIVFDTETLSDGAHTFSALAVDGKGNASPLSSVTVTVDNEGPAVAFNEPLDGAFVSGDIAFEVAASDSGAGLKTIEILAGGSAPTVDPSETFTTPQASATLSGSEDSTLRPDGPLTFTARAVDDAGNETLASVTVNVDNSAPEKSLLYPTDGQRVKGTIAITAESSSADLDVIVILVDGNQIATSVTSPVCVNYDTRERLDGEMVVTAVVRDLAGNESSCSATVTVNNIKVKLRPRILNLKRKARGKTKVKAHLFGPNLELLVPFADHSFELRVPGGSPVPAISGDDQVYCGHIAVEFSRRALINSIRAGIACGSINPWRRIPIELVADGHSIGTVRVRVVRY